MTFDETVAEICRVGSWPVRFDYGSHWSPGFGRSSRWMCTVMTKSKCGSSSVIHHVAETIEVAASGALEKLTRLLSVSES